MIDLHQLAQTTHVMRAFTGPIPLKDFGRLLGHFLTQDQRGHVQTMLEMATLANAEVEVRLCVQTEHRQRPEPHLEERVGIIVIVCTQPNDQFHQFLRNVRAHLTIPGLMKSHPFPVSSGEDELLYWFV